MQGVRRSISIFFFLSFCASVSAQIHILGKDPDDRVLAEWWSQNSNTSNTVQGINQNAGTNQWAEILIPVLLTNRALAGTNYVIAWIEVNNLRLTNSLYLHSLSGLVKGGGSGAAAIALTLNANQFSDSSGNQIRLIDGAKATNLNAITSIKLGTQATIKYGTGSPEGVVTADIGSVFHREDGAPGTALYLKDRYNGANTGWVAVVTGVSGPATSTTNAVATFADATGKVLKNTGVMVVTNDLFADKATFTNQVQARNYFQNHSTLTYGATTDVDFNADGYRTLTLAGNVTFTSSNRGAGRTLVVRILSDGLQRTFTFPVGWKFHGGSPANIPANRTAILSLTCFGSADNDIVAAYSAEP